MATGYKCTSTSCYSYQSPQTDQVFKALQTALNRFSVVPAIAFKPIAVDGVIGKATTSTLLAVLFVIGNQTDARLASTVKNAVQWLSTIKTPNDVAGQAANLQAQIDNAASILGLGAVKPPYVEQEARITRNKTETRAALI